MKYLITILILTITACTTQNVQMSSVEKNAILNHKLMNKKYDTDSLNPKLWTLERTLFVRCSNYSGMAYQFSQVFEGNKIVRYWGDSGNALSLDFSNCREARVTWIKNKDKPKFKTIAKSYAKIF